MRKIVLLSLLALLSIQSVSVAESFSPSSSSRSELESIRKLADGGYAEAQFQIAMALQVGLIVQPDLAEAAKYLELAANQKHSLAASHLGVAYLSGKGVAKNTRTGFYWTHIAADLDDLAAQVSLSQLYLEGTGTSKNYTASYFWALVASNSAAPISSGSPQKDFGASLAWSDLTNLAKNLAARVEPHLNKSTIEKIQNEAMLHRIEKNRKPDSQNRGRPTT